MRTGTRRPPTIERRRPPSDAGMPVTTLVPSRVSRKKVSKSPRPATPAPHPLTDRPHKLQEFAYGASFPHEGSSPVHMARRLHWRSPGALALVRKTLMHLSTRAPAYLSAALLLTTPTMVHAQAPPDASAQGGTNSAGLPSRSASSTRVARTSANARSSPKRWRNLLRPLNAHQFRQSRRSY